MNRITHNREQIAQASRRELPDTSATNSSGRSTRRHPNGRNLPDVAWNPGTRRPLSQDQNIVNTLRNLLDLLTRLKDLLGRQSPSPAPAPTPLPAPISGQQPKVDPQKFIGLPAKQAEEQARKEGISQLRIVPNDGMITLDYRPARLNLYLDQQGTVARADFG
jgi:hypothetical protein